MQITDQSYINFYKSIKCIYFNYTEHQANKTTMMAIASMSMTIQYPQVLSFLSTILILPVVSNNLWFTFSTRSSISSIRLFCSVTSLKMFWLIPFCLLMMFPSMSKPASCSARSLSCSDLTSPVSTPTDLSE